VDKLALSELRASQLVTLGLWSCVERERQ